MAKTPTNITLYFLQTSRAIRVAWLLEALNLGYKLERFERNAVGLAGEDLKAAHFHALGKSPAITDGDLGVVESGAIIEYICGKYDKDHVMIPREDPDRIRVLEWIHAAEATYCMHTIAIVFLRRAGKTAGAPADVSQAMEEGLSGSVKRDMKALNDALEGRNYLVGNHLSAADISMHFTIACALDLSLGVKAGEYPHVDRWLAHIESLDSYKETVERTGYISPAGVAGAHFRQSS